MILTGAAIENAYTKGDIILSPFDESQINPNSYNYRLGDILKVFVDFDGQRSHFKALKIPDNGIVLEPNQMYLGHTYEIIGSKKYAMSLIGRSSLGRLGLFLQISANLGHTTSAHQWTLEIVATKRIRIYPKMIIGQVSFWVNKGKIAPTQHAYSNYNLPQENLGVGLI